MAPDDQNQNSTPEENVAPSLSSTSNSPIQDQTEPKNANRIRTKLHEVINEKWGYNWLDDDAFDGIIKYADPEMARMSKEGFDLELRNGKRIKWLLPSQQDPNERITGPSRGFDQDAAAAMVSLARLRGWKTMNVNGTVEQKEMLWLAVMRQNLLEMEAFERDQKLGKIPKTDKDGNPITFSPLEVANFTPLADSKVYQQWLQEKADWDARHAPAPELTQENEETKPAPEKKPEEVKKEAPENKGPEEKKPETETQKQEAEKKPAADSKFTAKKDDPSGSKFMAKGQDKPFSSKFNKVNNKPHNTLTHHKHRGGSKHQHPKR